MTKCREACIVPVPGLVRYGPVCNPSNDPTHPSPCPEQDMKDTGSRHRAYSPVRRSFGPAGKANPASARTWPRRRHIHRAPPRSKSESSRARATPTGLIASACSMRASELDGYRSVAVPSNLSSKAEAARDGPAMCGRCGRVPQLAGKQNAERS
jgi:hypothetical protein